MILSIWIIYRSLLILNLSNQCRENIFFIQWKRWIHSTKRKLGVLPSTWMKNPFPWSQTTKNRDKNWMEMSQSCSFDNSRFSWHISLHVIVRMSPSCSFDNSRFSWHISLHVIVRMSQSCSFDHSRFSWHISLHVIVRISFYFQCVVFKSWNWYQLKT